MLLMARPPALTTEERRAALLKAANHRKVRAQYKEAIRTGTRSWREALESEDEAILKMRVKELLESIPGFGAIRVIGILDRVGISHARRVKGLGANQKLRLLEELRGR